MVVPDSRIRAPGDLAVQGERPFVVYWMIGARRTSHSFALDRAFEHARALDKPLLILEPLRAGYRWASDRFHAFVLAGMRDNAAACARAGVAYHPYIEPEPGAGSGLVAALGAWAAVIVTDEALGFFQPRMIEAAERVLDVRLEVVDGNGIIPVHDAGRAFPTAYAFRRALQKTVLGHVEQAPVAAPLENRTPRGARGAEVPRKIEARWPATDLSAIDVSKLPIDHAVRPSTVVAGGTRAGRTRLQAFVEGALGRYADDRPHPDRDGQSGLSPWLHFGHVSADEVFRAVVRDQGWTPARAGKKRDGTKEGFWGMDENAEAFLDELITWRELALNGAAYLPGFDSYEGTPAWAQRSLAEHAKDKRPYLYTKTELEQGRTHDDVWNAAQRQLVDTGVLHNALRMLWGKNVLAWSRTPRKAFDTLVELNNKYAIDGRDPSSYAGIGWCFGRYDRPWPERPVFGVVRAMTTESTRRKLKLKRYLETFGPSAPPSR